MKHPLTPIARALCCALALAFGLATASAALVAHWPLDDDASDATGNGHDGVVVSGTVNFGQPGASANTGAAAAFPDNGHIDVPYAAALNPGIQAPDGSGSFTIALWANSSDNAGFNSPFTAREDNGTTVNGPIIYNNNGGVWSYWAGNNGLPGAWNPLNSDPVPLDTWQHIAVTYDSATLTRKMFIDGAEVLSANLGVSANVLRDIHIGSGQDDGLNFYWNGLIDDVGLWDEALSQADIQSVIDNGIGGGDQDPRISVPAVFELDLDGSVQQFNIPVTNNGETENLDVTGTSLSDAANFSVDSTPAGITPGTMADIQITFDPMGANGRFEAALDVTSNDPVNPVKTIALRGILHDPKLVADDTLDFGTESTASLTITNEGATQALTISSFSISGPNATNFSTTNFLFNLPAQGGSGNLNFAFDPKGGEGTFRATMTINSNDPINPQFAVELIARVAFTNPLVAWWPLDVDGTDASGNGFDGTVVGVVPQCPGASGATGGSLEFDGASRIDVPYDDALNPDDFTVTLWANADTAAGQFNSPITNRDDVAGPITHGFILYNNNLGNWDFWTGDGDAGWDGLVGPAVATGSWSHLAISYDSATDTKTLYVDGDVAATDNVPQSGVAQYVKNGTIESEDLHIGAGQDDGMNFWFDGKIDDVALFRVSLTEADIESIMANGVAGFTGASGLFQMLDLQFGPEPGQITVSWTSQAGAVYAVQRSTDLNAQWEELTDDADSEGEITTFVDTTLPAGTKRVFYRAIRL